MVMLVVAGLLVAAPASGAEPSAWRYTMVAFSNASDRDMDVFESADGTGFQLVKPSAYRPPSGLVRDPSIFRNTDGMYYLTYTTGGTSIGFARSSDRITWTPLANYSLPFCCAFMPGTGDGTGSASPPGFSGSAGFSDGPSLSPFVTKAWAPEWFVDGGRVNVIVSMSTGGGFVPYLMTALEPSLRLWSLPVPLAGIGADHIDTTVVKVGSTYHAFTKNETKKVIEHAVAPSATGPYSFVPPGDWGTLVEGPALAQLPDGTWRLYLDAYTEGKYLYSDSTDGLSTWSDAQELPGLSGTVRHIGVMREPA
ncbi:arabinofuranosidase [Rhodococcus sp. AD45-ID]|uniref:glycoside hydrolase family 43 protein n=1 Tax=unclassified Rhodococcus (in: high G+C Gram-positive bacteria) TaxID=192944 RepID=UPI0005D302A9|nr:MULTISPECIES: glycoside hydrolase family 43 protein [unclassified Rhodococcus (in: high G+C Gram-positive bacteria)]KJF21543.1 Beta-xylosidase [Rhodococcus sp. AD45]PSR39013.1 arabinofuranosidase [Rhodococcus sp. AD45-ID]